MIMDELENKLISIKIHEPFNWNNGSLSGRIINSTEQNITIKMFRKIKGNIFKSDTLMISPRYHDDKFEILTKRKELTINGALKNKAGEIDFILTGIAKLI
jgi:hypothetical protein